MKSKWLNFLKKPVFIYSISSLIFVFGIQNLSANSVQFFNSASYQNPARMNTTQNTHLLTGAMYTNVYGRFTGKVLGTEGTIKTNNNLLFPYIVFSHRISDRIVGGMDVSNPVLGYISWPPNGFQQNFGIDANLLSYEIAPKLSIKINDNWAIGGSVRYFNLWRAELNFSVLNSFERNRANGDSWGGSVGLWYMYNPKNFADISYFTPIKVTLNRQGSSTSGTLVDRNFYFKKFTYSPGTIVLNLTHIFNQTFLAAAKVTYSFWDVCKALVLKNTIIGLNPTVFTLDWKNTFSAALFGRAQTTKSTAFMAVFGYDQSLVNSGNNVVAFPIGDLFFAGIGGEYRYSERGVFQLMISQARTWRPKIHTTAPDGFHLVDGVSLPRYSLVDLSTVIDF